MANAIWDFMLCDAMGNNLSELATASGRTVTFKRNSYSEVQLTLAHEDDSASLLLSALANTGVPKLKCYRRGPNDSLDLPAPLRFRGYLAAFSETSEETSLLTATFRSPFGVLAGDGSQAGRFLTSQFPTTYLSMDAGFIAKALIDTANLDSPTGLATDPSLIRTTVNRSCVYPVAQNLGSAITDLSAVLDGFDFFESFVETGTTTRTPLSGTPQNLIATTSSTMTWSGGPGTFYWVVTAIVGGVESPASNEATQTLVLTTDNPVLTWTAVAGATGYNLYRSTLPGGEVRSPSLVAALGAGVTTYADPGNPTTTGAASSASFGSPWYPDAFFNVTPSLGIVNSNACFEYGATTLSNVASLTRTTTPPQNCILVIGGNGMTSQYSDGDSVAQYGKWWGYYDESSIVDQGTLDARARALCRPHPIKTITFVPELALDNCPKPFDDFNLGDTVSIYASRASLVENAQVRLDGFTIPISDAGAETMQITDPNSLEADMMIRASFTASEIVG